MPVLLLTRGDAPGRDLLRRAIDARYGFQPPTIESLHATFKGSVRVTRGFYKGGAPITLELDVRFPFQARAVFAGRLLMVSVATEVDVFDGTSLYSTGKEQVSAREAEAARRQLWALNTLLLTPLNDMGVELHTVGELAFDAVHKATGLSARVTLDQEHRVVSVGMTAYNPEAGRDMDFELRPGIEQIGFGDLILPLSVSFNWDNFPTMQLTTVSASLNPVLSDDLFTLAK